MTAYYNEFDPKAAAWLRELIKRGLIADGVVDERSILDVTADDLRGFTQCHFFAGIGGWSYALRLAGWPDDRPVWTGSPPCQPFSAAGQQKGKNDDRHLAPHFASLVAAGRPPVLFGEQVASSAVFGKAAKRAGSATAGAPEWAWIDDLSGRLEAAHYAVGASDIPAAGVGAPHIRQRTFFGAQRLDDPAGSRYDGSFSGPEELARNETWVRLSGAGRGHDGMADADGATGRQDAGGAPRDEEAHGRAGRDGRGSDGDHGLAGHGEDGRPGAYYGGWDTADWLFCRDGKWRPVEPGTFPLAHGVPARVGRLRGYGNAIVPQAAALFITAFTEANQ
jgi:DNA (cytosine-5)-methyltransferase 1